MGPGICIHHGIQDYTLTSPIIADRIGSGEMMENSNVEKLRIIGYGREFSYVVDKWFLKSIFGDDEARLLIGKDKNAKMVNDVPLIRDVTSKMKWVCPVCLARATGQS